MIYVYLLQVYVMTKVHLIFIQQLDIPCLLFYHISKTKQQQARYI